MRKCFTRLTALAAALALILAAVPAFGAAEESTEFIEADLAYKLRTDAGTGEPYAVLTGGTPVKDLAVPAEAGGVPVRGVGAGFAASDKGWASVLETLTVAEGVREIGENAFIHCVSLREVVLPDSLESVGEAAFVNIAAESLSLPENAAEGSPGFLYCSAIRPDETGKWEYGLLGDGTAVITYFTDPEARLVIPDTVDGIPVSVVARVPLGKIDYKPIRAIRAVVLPKELRAVEHQAFEYCASLAKIELPKNLVSVGYAAFKGCSSLASASVPETVVRIGAEAFSDCGKLSLQKLPAGLDRIERRTFYRCMKLGKVVLPASVRTVEDQAFAYSQIPALLLNDGLETIGKEAFFGHRLKEIVLPASLRTVGDAAFDPDGGKTLKKVTFNGIATKCGTGVFGYDNGWNAWYRKTRGSAAEYDTSDPENWIDYYRDGGSFGQNTLALSCYPGSRADQLYQYNVTKTYLKGTGDNAVTAPEDRVLKAGLYTNDDMVYEIVVPEGVEEIDDCAFAGLLTLSRITLPSTLSVIGDRAFEGCTGLSEIVLKTKSMEWIGSAAFKGCTQLKKITVPAGITEIGESAFEDCAALEACALPQSGLLRIGDRAFAGCTKLAALKLPNGLESIGTEAFSRCGVAGATIPDSVTFIGKKAYYASGLKAIKLPKEMDEIPEYLCAYSSKLSSLKLPAKMTRIGKGAFMWCPVGGFSLPEGLVSIGEKAFAFDMDRAEAGRKITTAKLTGLKLPASLKIIEKEAFAANDALTSVRFPRDSQLEEIGENAFAMCFRLQALELPDSLRRIGSGAFRNCVQMTKVKLGSGVEELGDEVFLTCPRLTSLTAPDSIKSVGNDLLKNYGSRLKVTCPESGVLHRYIQKNYPSVPVEFPKKK